MVTAWTGVLISQLLELTHKMCTTRWDVLHYKAEDELPLEDSRPLRKGIKEKYLLVTVGIPPGDSHLLDQPLKAKLKLLAITNNNWIISAIIYREEATT